MLFQGDNLRGAQRLLRIKLGEKGVGRRTARTSF
jgi:hypothetical protein